MIDREDRQSALDFREAADLSEYGYIRADQDGWNGEVVSPQEHNEEVILEAAAELLDAREVGL